MSEPKAEDIIARLESRLELEVEAVMLTTMTTILGQGTAVMLSTLGVDAEVKILQGLIKQANIRLNGRT